MSSKAAAVRDRLTKIARSQPKVSFAEFQAQLRKFERYLPTASGRTSRRRP